MALSSVGKCIWGRESRKKAIAAYEECHLLRCGALKIEAIGSSEISVLGIATRRHIPGGCIF
jgi:hypothetical protein